MLGRDRQAHVLEAVSQKARPARLAAQHAFHASRNDINLAHSMYKYVPDRVIRMSYHCNHGSRNKARGTPDPRNAGAERVDVRIGVDGFKRGFRHTRPPTP